MKTIHYSLQKTRPHSNESRSGKEGSALLTAVIFTFVVMLLMGSYLYLSSSEYKLASRSYLFGASFSLAEGGIDLALDALSDKDSSGWAQGTAADGRSFWARHYMDYDLGANITGEIKVVILGPHGNAPEIYSEGTARGAMGAALSKQLKVDLSTGFYPFFNGFESARGVTLKGQNVIFDSYDSRVGSYGPGNVGSEITVSTISVEADAVDIGNATVYGYVATGGQPPDVGNHGSITSYENQGNGIVDESRITTDYYAEFPAVRAPELPSFSTSFPSNGFVTGGNFKVHNWSMSGNNVIWITGDVTLVASGDLNISGNSAIFLTHGATLRIFVEGDATLSGGGIANVSGKPNQLLIFGTHPTPGGQTIKISGNGALAATVYAPNANAELKGGGSSGRVLGAIVAYESKLVGNSHFSYDQALSEYNVGGTGFSVEEWAEITGVSTTSQRLNMAEFGL